MANKKKYKLEEFEVNEKREFGKANAKNRQLVNQAIQRYKNSQEGSEKLFKSMTFADRVWIMRII